MGVSGAKIFCNNVLETSELFIAVGFGVMQSKNDEGTAKPVPATIVINDNGTRRDIPVHEVSVPLSILKNAGVKSINAISVIMTNPSTGTEGSFETILSQKQTKALDQINKIYSFYLKMDK